MTPSNVPIQPGSVSKECVCPNCGSNLQDIKQKYICPRCGIVEGCCEGGRQ